MSAEQIVKNTQNPSASYGTLYIVPTPIGNLQDLTERAGITLREVDYVAAEDTRHSKPLLQHVGSKARIIAVHEHNEQHKIERIVKLLTAGQSVALISDAGTPLISDPGYVLVRACRHRNLPVVALPGPCAITTALSGAGIATDRFSFEGFLPAKPQQRRKLLEQLVTEPRTMVFYETPHRILHALADISTVLGNERHVVLARELTKQFETFLSGTAAELEQRLIDDVNQQRGEMVLMISGYETDMRPQDEPLPAAQKALALLCQELPLKKAAAIVAELYGERKNALYQWGLKNLNK